MNTTDDTNNEPMIAAGSLLAPDQCGFASALERDAARFLARPKDSDGELIRPLRLMVADFEFAYDRGSYAGYAVSEGKDGRTDLRWPFHRIAAASWMVLRFDPQSDVPVVEECLVIANDEADEQAIVIRFFDALLQNSDAVLATWAGEFKDFAVLRRCAGEFGLLLPRQLRDLNPYAYARLDLCQAVTGKAKPVHLPEYAIGTNIPCKPSPSKDIGPLVEHGKWSAVRDQCLADVLTTTVICLRHLAAHGVIAIHPQRSLLVLAEAAAKASPASKFMSNTFSPWARAQVAGARLKGTVYRAA